MRRKTAEPMEPQDKPAVEPKASATKTTGRNWRPVIFMGFVLFLAAFVRFVFSYSVSAGSDFAISGGMDASNNLRFIETIVSDGKIVFFDDWMSYPDGSLNVVPVLFDLVAAAIALLANVFFNDAAVASSYALALTGPLFGVLACIPMYFVGKEMFSSKTAGFLAAVFLALCPVFVQESVYSNGTGMSFAVFLFLIGLYLLIRAIKSLGEPVDAYKKSLCAGAFIAAAMLSWLDFRQVAIPFVIVMVAQTIIDRFKGKDPRPAATIYTMVMAVGFVIPCAVYTALGYWNVLVSGTMIFTVLAIGFVTAYAWTYKKSWVLTFPVCAGVCIAILIALAIAAPALFDVIFHGNSVYAAEYADLIGRQSLTLSQLTSFYGVVTYWFVFLGCLYMAFRFPKNSSSVLYVFTMVWLFVMPLTLGHNAKQAAFAAPVFALGFAYICKLVLDHVDFKTYFNGIKTGAGSKTKIRRIISPIPLISILIAVLLVAAPNMMQVVDAGISSNDAEDYNDQIRDVTGNDQFGSLNYYIKTNDSWTIRSALSDIKGDDNGAVVSWLGFSDDVKIYSKMKSFTDVYGNGADLASNILLANGVNGASSAALLVAGIMEKGLTDGVKAALGTAVNYDEIQGVLDSVDYKPNNGDKTVKDLIFDDYVTYGAVNSDISDRNIKFLYLSNYIAVNCHSYDINTAFDSLGLRTPYIMVTGDMMPFFYGYAGVFDQMAALNGYEYNSYGAVPKFTSWQYSSYYTFTTAMYDTLLYRTYVGMTPTEAGYSSLSMYLTALSAADSKVHMHPGYGLSNYEIAYWHVMYNASSNATSDSDGWEEMDANAAIQLQKEKGGLINYISGLPVILKYVPTSADNLVEGKVTDPSSAGIKDIRVSAVDENGVLRATTHTGDDGTFRLYVADKAHTKIVYFGGAGTASSGGVLLGQKEASGDVNLPNIDMEATVNITLTDGNATYDVVDGSNVLQYDMVITNTITNKTILDLKAGQVFNGNVGIGPLKFVLSKDGTEVASAEFLVAEDAGLSISLSAYEYTIKVTDKHGVPLEGKTVEFEGPYGIMSAVGTDVKGEVKFSNVPKGEYTVKVDGYYTTTTTINVSGSDSTTIVVSDKMTISVTLPAPSIMVYVYGDGFSTSVLAGTSTTVDVDVPISDISATEYTVYAFYDGKIYHAMTNANAVDISTTASDIATVSGMLKNSDDTNVSGDIVFYNDAGEKFKVKADADKGFKAYLPVGDFNVYATDSSDAYFGTLTVTAGANDGKDIKMSDADHVTANAYWKGSTGVKYPYVMIKANINSKEMHLMTDSKGEISLYLPKDMGATFTLTPTNTFKAITEGKTIATDHTSLSLVFDMALESEIALTFAKGPVLASVSDDTNLSIGGTTKKISDDGETKGWVQDGIKVTDTNGGSMSVTLGSSSDAVYYSVTHKFNPVGLSGTITLDQLLNNVTSVNDITYYTVTVKNWTSDYTATAYYMDKNDVEKTKTLTSSATRIVSVTDTSDPLSIRIEIKDKENTKLFVETVSFTVSSPTKEYDVNAITFAEASLVSGYVGVDASVKITFDDGVNTPFRATASSGTYERILVKGTTYNVEIDDTVSGSKYVLTSTSITPDAATYKRNFNATGNVNTVDVPASTFITGDALTTVSFTIPKAVIVNTTSKMAAYTFSAGSGWQSYTVTYLGKEVSGIAFDSATADDDLVFTGRYITSLYSLGTSALSFSLTNGTDTLAVKYTDFTEPDPEKQPLLYLNKESDSVGDHYYEYIYTVANTGSNLAKLTLDVSGISHAGWFMMFKVKNDLGTFTISGSETEIYIYPGTTTLSVVLIPESVATGDIPSGDVKFTYSHLATATSDDITIEGGTATSKVSSATTEVTASDMSASGRDVVNDKGKIPVIVWVMIAAMALLLILIFWMASKRGVFARKN